MSPQKTSESLFERARHLIPGGVNSPVRSFKHVGMHPIFFERAKGAVLQDVSGKEYTDFCLSFGPHILGHSHPKVVKAIEAQVQKATSFGACHEKEVELAELILKAYPSMDRVRLVNSGTEAVMTAVRIARGFTKRPKILKFDGCYHGHVDSLLVKAGSGVAELASSSSDGIPEGTVADTIVVRMDQIETVEEAFKKYPGQIAAVIMEPIPANHSYWVPTQAHLAEICSIASRHGALTIFDEVISGFRVAFGGACEYFGLKPDLVTLGKIIGGGLPLAAIAGRKVIMDTLAPLGSVYQAGTLSGNPLATAAGVAVLQELITTNPYETLHTETALFTKQLATLLGKLADVEMRQMGSIFWFSLAEHDSAFPPTITPKAHEYYTMFFKMALSQGVYFAPSPYEVAFTSTAHSRAVLEGVIERLSRCPELK